MTPALIADTQLKRKEIGRWQHNETIVTLLEDQSKSCYTMCLVKYGKVISEVSREDKDIGKLLVALLDPVPIDPEFLKLN